MLLNRFNFLVLIVLLALSVQFASAKSKYSKMLVNKAVWLDTDGNPINAHGGSILYHKGTYYWYGEIKDGKTWLVPGQCWLCYRTNAGGVACYSSKNLVKWKFEGKALAPEMTDSASDIHFSRVLERPKVIYNETTNKFVMWLHVDSQDYSYARAGVAISDKPTGPFTYIESMRPNGQMSRDMTVFKDDNQRAYLIYSSENNATTHISELSDDYLKPLPTFKRFFINQHREAPAVFKYNKKYYIINSGCTGWQPNKALLAVADSVLGEWKNLGNPCHGDLKDVTFGGQSTFVLPVQGQKNAFIFMADVWNMKDLADSRYIWLPMVIENETITIPWRKSFRKTPKSPKGDF